MAIGRFAWVVACIGSFAASARADVCLVASEPHAIERVVAVESVSEESGGAWLSIETRGASRIAWVLDDRAGALEPRGGGFLESLDALTTPVVVPPPISPYECAWLPRPAPVSRVTVEADDVREIEDVGVLEDVLGRYGARLEDCELRVPVRVVEFETPSRFASTSVVRASRGAAPALRASFDIAITFLTFGAGTAHEVSMPEVSASELEVSYLLASRSDDYSRVREAALDRLGRGAVREASVPLLRRGATNAERFPLFAGYFAGLSLSATCLARLEALSGGYAAQPFSAACPLERPVRSPWPALPACEEVTPPGTLRPDLLRCDGADDFALALSGTSLASGWLTRSSIRLGRGVVREVEFSPGTIEEPELRPARIDSSSCVPIDAPRTPRESPPITERPNEGPVFVGSQSPGVDVVIVGTNHEHASCSGDSSSSSREEESCSGDSSSTSDDDAACSGDSSSSSDDDTSCFGTPKASSGVRASPRAGGARTAITRVGKSRRHRPRLSLWTIAITGVWLPIRRLGRARAPWDGR